MGSVTTSTVPKYAIRIESATMCTSTIKRVSMHAVSIRTVTVERVTIPTVRYNEDRE